VTVYEAAQKSRLDALLATRDALALAIDAGGGTVAQSVAQFRAVLVEIEDIEKAGAVGKGTALDELARRRDSQAPGAAGPAKRNQRR
jgi:hypothetical protein